MYRAPGYLARLAGGKVRPILLACFQVPGRGRLEYIPSTTPLLSKIFQVQANGIVEEPPISLRIRASAVIPQQPPLP